VDFEELVYGTSYLPQEPRQIEHAPEVQAFLDKLAAVLDIGAPAEDQTAKNPDCMLEEGSIKCLNAASDLCNHCEWWAGIASEEED
jgi:hypothetical protein